MLIGPPIPEMHLLQKLTLKIQSHNVSLTSYRLTSLCFRVNPPPPIPLPTTTTTTTIPEIQQFLNLTLKIQGKGHTCSSRSQSRYNTISTHILFVPCRPALTFLTVRNPLLSCPLVLVQDGGTRSRQKCLHRDFSAPVLFWVIILGEAILDIKHGF